MRYVLLALALCSGQILIAQKRQSKVVVIDHSLIAVFDHASQWAFPNSKPATLSTQDYLDIEALLTQCFDEYNARQRSGVKKARLDYPKQEWSEESYLINWKPYWKQYVPVITENGDKEIWINCVCELWPNEYDRFKKYIMMVEDGGKCYFNLKMNLSKHKYYNLSVNVTSGGLAGFEE